MARKPTKLGLEDDPEGALVEEFLKTMYPSVQFLKPKLVPAYNAWKAKKDYIDGAAPVETPTKPAPSAQQPVTEADLTALRGVFPNISQAQEKTVVNQYKASDHPGPLMAFMYANPALAIKIGGIGTKGQGAGGAEKSDIPPIGAWTTGKKNRFQSMFLQTIFDARSLGAEWVNPEAEKLVEAVVTLLTAQPFDPVALNLLLRGKNVRYLDIGGQFPTDEDEAKRIIYACWEAGTALVVGYKSLSPRDKWGQRMTRPPAKTGKTARNQCKPSSPENRTNRPDIGPKKGASFAVGPGQTIGPGGKVRFIDGTGKKKKKKKR